MSFTFLPNGGEPNALMAPTGTRLIFNQTQVSCPGGWAVDASAALTDCSLRVNAASANGGSGGGTTGWSSWNFGGTFGVNGFTISVAQMPFHNHGINDPGHVHGVADPGHSHTFAGTTWWLVGGSDLQEGTNSRRGTQVANPTIGGSATGIGIAGAFTGISTAGNGSGAGIFPTYTTPQLKFTDTFIAVKL